MSARAIYLRSTSHVTEAAGIFNAAGHPARLAGGTSRNRLFAYIHEAGPALAARRCSAILPLIRAARHPPGGDGRRKIGTRETPR